jgi:hypothetical protein
MEFVITSENKMECFIKTNTREIYNYENWIFNRNINKSKVEEIKKVLGNNDILDSILSYVYIEKTNSFILFDGQHRLTAMKELFKNDKKIIQCICYVKIIKNVELEDEINHMIAELFQIKNLQTPIPAIYIEQLKTIGKKMQNKNKIDIINRLFCEYSVKYRNFYKLSNNVNKPNFNEFKFVNLCNEIEFETYNELKDKIEKMNEEGQNKIGTKKQMEKCKKENFYLFL